MSQDIQYWLIVTSLKNFRHSRDVLKLKTQGFPYFSRKIVKKMSPSDKVVYYIMKAQKFGAIATITGTYYHDESRLWPDQDEMWPSRCPSKPVIALNDDELLDVKKLIPDLQLVKEKEKWGLYFRGHAGVRRISEEDFNLIESEMKKIVAKRGIDSDLVQKKEIKTEDEYEQAIMDLPLESESLHDRLGEMLEQIGSWMEYNPQTRHKITPDHAYELDVAWLSGKNPEIAIEIQIGGNITEAKDRLSQARKFNYRKVIIVLLEKDLERLNKIMRHELELRNWMEAWSIGAVYEMYNSGEKFFRFYQKLKEAVYKDKKEIALIK